MTTMNDVEMSLAKVCSLPAYSLAPAILWIEQGPTIINRRGSFPIRIFSICSRDVRMKSFCWADIGSSCLMELGGGNDSICKVLKVSIVDISGFAFESYRSKILK